MTHYVFVLTPARTKKLREVLAAHQDCGPLYEGWQSDELEDLKARIEQEYKEQKPKVEPE